MLPFHGLSVVRALHFVLKRQRISTRFLLYTTVPCLSQIVVKFGLHQSTLPLQILPQSDSLADLSLGDIRRQIAAEWLAIAQWSQWTAYRKPPSLFRMVPPLINYDLPFPKMGVLNAPQGPTSRRVLPPGEYDS